MRGPFRLTRKDIPIYIGPSIEAATIETAVQAWLDHLGLGSELETHDHGMLGHEIRMGVPGISDSVGLPHLGVGMSQVLPILVMGLLAPEGSTLIFEQPELHLHPAVQTKLADFFLGLMELGKQVIIETHSEHIINRVRLKSLSRQSPSGIALYFARRSEGQTYFERINVGTREAFADWPEGFFDEFQKAQEELIQASLNRKRRIGFDDSLEDLIAKGESEKLEFKSTLSWNIKTKSDDKEITFAILKTIAAFLNTDGGILLVGVSDDGGGVGLDRDHFENEDQASRFFTDKIKNHLGEEHAAEDPEVRFEDYAGKRILRAHCLPSGIPAFLTYRDRECFFVRTGAATNELSPRKLHGYIQRRFHSA